MKTMATIMMEYFEITIEKDIAYAYEVRTGCCNTNGRKLCNFDDLSVQVLSDKKKRDVYDRFGEEGLKTNNGGGGGGDHHKHHRHHLNLDHFQSHTVVTRSMGTRSRRSSNFLGPATPLRAFSTCLGWDQTHIRLLKLNNCGVTLL